MGETGVPPRHSAQAFNRLSRTGKWLFLIIRGLGMMRMLADNNAHVESHRYGREREREAYIPVSIEDSGQDSVHRDQQHLRALRLGLGLELRLGLGLWSTRIPIPAKAATPSPAIRKYDVT